jgi:N-acetylglucosamine malate deacetylase 2
MLAGGTLWLLAHQGAAVHYLCATRGEGGEAGEPPLCRREELGSLREAEMTCAVRALGGAGLEFLEFVDPEVGQNQELFPYTSDLENLAQQLVGHIQKLEAEVVLTHGSNGEYGHPAHVITHQAALRAWKLLGILPETQHGLYTVQATFSDHPKPRLSNKDDPADLVIDISPAREAKVQAAMCHRSQHALFVRRASQEAGRPLTVPEVIVTLESLRRVKLAVCPKKGPEEQDPLFSRLSPWAFNDTRLEQ